MKLSISHYYTRFIFILANHNWKGIRNFVLFNDAWSQKRTFGVKYDSYTRIKFFITSITITYYHHFRDHVLTFISITNLYTFLYRFIALRKERTWA